MRLGHRRQAGVSLIEAVVAVGILGLAIAAIVGGLAAVEKDSGAVSSSARLDVVMRKATDALRSDAIAYRCAPGADYRTSIQPFVPAPFVVVSATAVSGVPTPGLRDPNCTADNGVQKITVTLASGSARGTRTVWKSDAAIGQSGGGGGGGGGNRDGNQGGDNQGGGN